MSALQWWFDTRSEKYWTQMPLWLPVQVLFGLVIASPDSPLILIPYEIHTVAPGRSLPCASNDWIRSLISSTSGETFIGKIDTIATDDISPNAKAVAFRQLLPNRKETGPSACKSPRFRRMWSSKIPMQI